MTSDLSPSTKSAQMIALIDEHIDTQDTIEFKRLEEKFLSIKVCTSLTDAEADERINLVPPTLTSRWVLTSDEDQAPVACVDDPDTHRHIIFEC